MKTDETKAKNLQVAQEVVLAAEALRARDGTELAIFTESRKVAGWVVVGLAQRGRPSVAIVINAREYDGLKLLAAAEGAVQSSGMAA